MSDNLSDIDHRLIENPYDIAFLNIWEKCWNQFYKTNLVCLAKHPNVTAKLACLIRAFFADVSPKIHPPNYRT